MYSTGLTHRVGGCPDGGKDPTCPLWRGITTHIIILLFWHHSLGVHGPAAARSTDQKAPLYARCPHPAADVDRLYAPCSDGGRGLQQIESTYQSCIVRLNCYLADSSDSFMQMNGSVTSENLHTRSSAWLVHRRRKPLLSGGGTTVCQAIEIQEHC